MLRRVARGQGNESRKAVSLSLTLSLPLPPFLSLSLTLSHCRPALWSCQNLRGIRTLDKMPLFEWSGSTRQMLNNGYVFTIVAGDELLVLG